MQASKLLQNLVARHVGRRAHSHSHHVTGFSDLPSPQGSWKTHFDANQRRYNLHLFAGILAVTSTIVFGRASGLLDFHSTLPDRPADIASYK